MRIPVPATPEMMPSADVLLMKGDVIYDNRLLANLKTDCLGSFKVLCGAVFTKEALRSIFTGFTSLSTRLDGAHVCTLQNWARLGFS